MELIKITEKNNKQVVSARDLHDFLGASERFQSWFDRYLQFGFTEDEDFTKNNSFAVVNNGAKKNISDYLISTEMAKSILLKIRYNKKSGKILKQLDNTTIAHHTKSRFEISFGSILTDMLNEFGIGIVRQYNVDGYRIDFYLPDFNIAIEYDEAQHFSKNNIKKDAEREEYIKNKIGCKFIRVNYKDSDAINVAKVLKQITTIKK